MAKLEGIQDSCAVNIVLTSWQLWTKDACSNVAPLHKTLSLLCQTIFSTL